MESTVQAVVLETDDGVDTDAIQVEATLELDFSGVVGTVEIDGSTYTVTITVSS